MKKLLSTFAAIAMLVASFATTSFAAVTQETPAKVAGSLTKIDVASDDYANNYASLCQDYVDMGLDLYSLKLSVVNAPTEVTFKSMGSKYTGSAVTFFSAQLAVTTDAILDEEYCYIEKTGAPIPSETHLKFAEGDAASVLPVVQKKSVTAGSTIDFIETVVAIAPGKTFSVDLIAAEVGTCNFNGAVATAPTADSYAGYILGAADGLLVKDASIADGLTIAEKEQEPEKAPEYFNASFTAGGPKYNGNKGMKFFFNSSKLNKVASYIFNFDEMFDDPTFEAETEVDVAIKVNDVPEDDTVTLTGYEWSETARVDN